VSTEMLTKNKRPTLEAHWDNAYADRGAAGVSWYEPTARVSLEIVSALNVPFDAALIDVGGGASNLAADLIAKGYTDVSVLDLSEIALREAHDRTGSAVAWLHADVLDWKPERQYASGMTARCCTSSPKSTTGRHTFGRWIRPCRPEGSRCSVCSDPTGPSDAPGYE
jgi:hypothetical protein